MTTSRLLGAVHGLLGFSAVYALNQRIGKPTTDRFRTLIRENMGNSTERRVLDAGCGIGNYRECFSGEYVGIDINPNYVESARERFRDQFEVMDATNLAFPANSFDDITTIATTHHLDDEQFLSMVSGACNILRPGGAFHIIDAVLPFSPSVTFKRFWFGLDRGRYPRYLDRLVELASKRGRVVTKRALPGPLHDTAYIRVVPD